MIGPPNDTIFTIGHSNRSIPEFVSVLRSAGIETLIDVRRFPASRRNPHFNIGPLSHSLSLTGIIYRHIPELGGYRESPADPRDSPNDGWPEGFLRNYADYAMTDPFHRALRKIRERCGHQPALMCAEKNWRDCHRQIIADHLLIAGHHVIHLIDAQLHEEATLTSFGLRSTDGSIRYPASSQQLRLNF